MAFRCSLCQYFSPSLALHVSHLRLVHSRDPSFYLLCGIDCCLEEFRTFSSFNSHVYRCHRIALGLEKPEKEITVPPSVQASSEEVSADDKCKSYYDLICAEYSGPAVLDIPPNSDSSPPLTLSFIKTNAKHILKLTEGRMLSQVAVADVIGMCREISQQAVSQVKQNVLTSLTNHGITPSEIAGLDEALSNVTDPFENISTTHNREKFFRENFHYLVRILAV